MREKTNNMAQLVTYTMALNAAPNSKVVDAPPTRINLEPGHAGASDEKVRPSFFCPVFACACFWLFVISALLYFLYARQANCVENVNDNVNAFYFCFKIQI